jgi:hypothetical protein
MKRTWLALMLGMLTLAGCAERGYYYRNRSYWGPSPRSHAVWVPGHWERHGNQNRYYEGHWR